MNTGFPKSAKAFINSYLLWSTILRRNTMKNGLEMSGQPEALSEPHFELEFDPDNAVDLSMGYFVPEFRCNLGYHHQPCGICLKNDYEHSPRTTLPPPLGSRNSAAPLQVCQFCHDLLFDSYSSPEVIRKLLEIARMGGLTGL